jgi:hypothetical protein
MASLLVDMGANINQETCTGKTALIQVRLAQAHLSRMNTPVQAAKAGSMPVVDYLMRMQVIVGYKTVTHRKTALNWAVAHKHAEARLISCTLLSC